MKTGRIPRISLVAAALLLLGASAPHNPYRIPAALDADLHAAYDDLFNLRFDAAARRIDAFQDQSSAHPMAALAKVVLEWWKLTVRVEENDESASRAFVSSAEACIALGSGPTGARSEARVAAGTAMGLLSRWSAANRAWLPAYTRGAKSASLLKDALKRNPAATDAYMTLGTFNYARGLLRERLHAAPSETDEARQEGIAQLRRAYASAPYFRTAAGLLLAGILTNDSPSEAVPLLRELRQQLPASAFVHTVLATALYNTGDLAALRGEADALSAGIDGRTYDAWFRPQALFISALVPFRERKWREAAALFDQAAKAGDESNPYTTWGRLYAGYAFDAMGKRDEAKARYRDVLARRARFASREHAEDRLRRTFRDGDPELQKLEL